MVELWISLVRNAACVLKSLLPPEYTMMQPLMRFPLFGGTGWAGTPLEMFTGLEGFIGILQVAGACFNLLKGAKALCDGIVMTSYIVSWRNALAALETSPEDKPKELDTLKEVLRRQHTVNNRKIIGGICQLVIGAGLLCLALFSWKLIGIIAAATAVAILEFALAALLAIGTVSVSKMWTVSTKVQGLKKSAARDLDVVEFLVPLSTTDSAWEPDVRMSPTVASLRGHMKGMAKIAQEVSERSLEECQAIAQTVKKQAALDAFVIALNVAAFWGYGTIPLDVFYPNRTLFTLWFPPGNTAWWGNFIGDVAWTIEPITMVVAPYLLLRQSREAGKLKSQ